MQYRQRVYISSILTEADAQNIIKIKRERFVTEALTESGFLQDGGFFTLRYSEKRDEALDLKTLYNADEMDIVQMSVELEPVKQHKAVYHSPEERFFRPEPTLKAKLKNCFAYLKDKTGGTIETEEVEICSQ